MTEQFTEGQRLVLKEDAGHGDLKTASVFPQRWPTLKKGTEVTFVKTFWNFYGDWVTVKAPNGEWYDVEPRKVEKQSASFYESVNQDVENMLKAGCKFKVVENPQQTSEYDTGWLVVLDPTDVTPRAKACDIVSFGKFWRENYALRFAETLNGGKS